MLRPVRDGDEPAELSESFLRPAPQTSAKSKGHTGSREGHDALEIYAVDGTQFVLQLCALLSLVFANALQHVVHPSLAVFEDAAASLRGADWEADFYVRDANSWTPPHEVMSQRTVGKFIFLTVQVLLFQLVYYLVCAAVYWLKIVAPDELQSPSLSKVYARLYTRLHMAAPIVDGLGVLVWFLFFVFAVIMDFVEPKWRGQVRCGVGGTCTLHIRIR